MTERKQARNVNRQGDPEELLTVNVPHGYGLTTDDHIVHRFEKGEQEMRRKHATHPYSIDNGVTEVK